MRTEELDWMARVAAPLSSSIVKIEPIDSPCIPVFDEQRARCGYGVLCWEDEKQRGLWHIVRNLSLVQQHPTYIGRCRL